jgi:hypothetical protein
MKDSRAWTEEINKYERGRKEEEMKQGRMERGE